MADRLNGNDDVTVVSDQLEEVVQSDRNPSEDLDRLHPEKVEESQTDTSRKSIGGLVNEAEIYTRIYFGGVDPDIRREVWPYLLGHHKWNATGKVNRIMTHFIICLRKIFESLSSFR